MTFCLYCTDDYYGDNCFHIRGAVSNQFLQGPFDPIVKAIDFVANPTDVNTCNTTDITWNRSDGLDIQVDLPINWIAV
jgi:hypothetical protein